MRRRHFNGLFMLAATGVATRASIAAESWPSRTISLVIPSAPGGLTDGFSRLIGDQLSAKYGVPVISVNKAGAGGIVGSEFVARAPADGYTLLVGNNGPLVVNPLIYAKVPYKPDVDFVPVSLLAVYPNVVVVNPALPIKTVAELIAYAKAKPGELNFGSAGIGQSHHLMGEVFKRMAKVDMRHVPYQGSGPALSALVGGQIQVMFSNVPPALSLIRSGRLRAIAVTTTAPIAALPGVPPVSDTLPGFDNSSWLCLVAPSGTPAEIVSRLNADIQAIVQTPAAKEFYAAQAVNPHTQLSPPEIKKFIDSEAPKWQTVIREGNIHAE